MFGLVFNALRYFFSRLTLHASRLTFHVSRLTFHTSRFTPHASRFTTDFYGKIGAPEFAKLAADTVLQPNCDGLFLFIKFQNVLGAKMDTNTASLAPVPVDDVFL
jgi:hypothetical protein